MPQVAGGEIRERAKRLRAAGEAALRKRLAAEVGATRQVLIESDRQGRTEHFLPVAIRGKAPGTVQPFTIAGHDGAQLQVCENDLRFSSNSPTREPARI
jgi:threonylcarbamoyladenosine tRNA methylthiotransferase MtaB